MCPGIESPVALAPAGRPEFGDYQVNGVMGIAKKLRENPRNLAQQVIDSAEFGDLISKAEVAGPGFINLTLSEEYMASELVNSSMLDQTDSPQTIVVDYSSPNLAKELHVGHLRSTVIGDAVARTLEYFGHTVILQNHVGDWGTTFGKLVAHLEETDFFDHDQVDDQLGDLERLYVEATTRFDRDEDFANRAREVVRKLQDGDKRVRQHWRRFLDVSIKHMHDIYRRLDVSLTVDDLRGESSYNDDLPRVIEDLEASKLLTVSEGAKCVFVDGYRTKDGNPMPMIVQKSDGGYLYHTTDLATIRYRRHDLNANRVLYFTDARQILHFKLLFDVARKAGFVANSTSLEHYPFGKILGEDGQPLKSREGTAIRLSELIDEGIHRSRTLVEQKSSHIPAVERDEIVNAITIGAIKYADLSKNSAHDYTFNWNTMLSLEGNTAPYIQYAYARIRSVFGKAGLINVDDTSQVQLKTPEERQLAVQLLRYQETIESLVRDIKPHYLCSYLYELTVRFMRFYEACPILNAPSDIRTSRLKLCERTANTIQEGMACLGIRVLTRM